MLAQNRNNPEYPEREEKRRFEQNDHERRLMEWDWETIN